MPYIEYDEVGASCPECGRNFRSPEDLDSHRVEVHMPDSGSKAKPRNEEAACAMCGDRFPTVAALRHHNERVHR